MLKASRSTTGHCKTHAKQTGSPVNSKHSYLLTGAHKSFLTKYALSPDSCLEWISLFLFKKSLLCLKNQVYLKLHVENSFYLSTPCVSKTALDAIAILLTCYLHLMPTAFIQGRGECLQKKSIITACFFSCPEGTEQLEIISRKSACVWWFLWDPGVHKPHQQFHNLWEGHGWQLRNNVEARTSLQDRNDWLFADPSMNLLYCRENNISLSQKRDKYKNLLLKADCLLMMLMFSNMGARTADTGLLPYRRKIQLVDSHHIPSYSISI